VIVSVGTEILDEASILDNLLRLYAEMHTNEVAQEIVDNVAIHVRCPEAMARGKLCWWNAPQ
jgi:hypothetical protein